MVQGTNQQHDGPPEWFGVMVATLISLTAICLLGTVVYMIVKVVNFYLN